MASQPENSFINDTQSELDRHSQYISPVQEVMELYLREFEVGRYEASAFAQYAALPAEEREFAPENKHEPTANDIDEISKSNLEYEYVQQVSALARRRQPRIPRKGKQEFFQLLGELSTGLNRIGTELDLPLDQENVRGIVFQDPHNSGNVERVESMQISPGKRGKAMTYSNFRILRNYW